MATNNGKLHMCQVCGKRPATVFIKNSINGKTIEKELCAECAQQLRDNGMLEDIFTNGINGFFSSIMGMPMAEEPVVRERTCPNCGMTERAIRESYSFGCSECYDTFRDLANEFVYKLGGSEHRGRTPKGGAAAVSSGGYEETRKKEPTLEERIEELERKKKEAVAREDYETASQIKNKIEKLKGRG